MATQAESKVLIVRKKKDGTVGVHGNAPKELHFSPSYFDREIPNGIAEVRITVRLSEGDLVYRLVGFGLHEGPEGEDPKPNYTDWVCELVEDPTNG